MCLVITQLKCPISVNFTREFTDAMVHKGQWSIFSHASAPEWAEISKLSCVPKPLPPYPHAPGKKHHRLLSYTKHVHKSSQRRKKYNYKTNLRNRNCSMMLKTRILLFQKNQYCSTMYLTRASVLCSIMVCRAIPLKLVKYSQARSL